MAIGGKKMAIKRINTRKELIELAKELQVRDSWHEPDEQGLEARVFGESFDNCGHWGSETVARLMGNSVGCDYPFTMKDAEIWITLYKDGDAIAEVNLAILFAFACGTFEG